MQHFAKIEALLFITEMERKFEVEKSTIFKTARTPRPIKRVG